MGSVVLSDGMLKAARADYLKERVLVTFSFSLSKVGPAERAFLQTIEQEEGGPVDLLITLCHYQMPLPLLDAELAASMSADDNQMPSEDGSQVAFDVGKTIEALDAPDVLDTSNPHPMEINDKDVFDQIGDVLDEKESDDDA